MDSVASVQSRKLSQQQPPQPHVLVVGGSYGGLNFIKQLQEQFSKQQLQSPLPVPQAQHPRITLLDERDGIYHSVGAPLAHTDSRFTAKAWKLYKKIPYLNNDHVSIIRGRMRVVDTTNKIATYASLPYGNLEKLDYDYLVVATGIRRSWPVVTRETVKDAYKADALRLIKDLESAEQGIVVVGGGAVGVEYAAEFKVNHPNKKVTLVHSHEEILSSEPLPHDYKQQALELLRETGVRTLLNHRVIRETKIPRADGSSIIKIDLNTGEYLAADRVLWCAGRQGPNTSFLPTNVLDECGQVMVTKHLTFPLSTSNACSHFAIGDVVRWTGIKRAGAAMAMGYHVANNIYQCLMGKHEEMGEFAEIRPCLVLAVGPEAISYIPSKDSEDGKIETGAEVLRSYFGDDLGLEVCWRVLGLTVDDD